MTLITTNLVNLDLIGDSKEAIILELAQLIDAEGRVAHFDQYLQSVLDREALTTTGIGFGIAIPHGKTEAVTKTTVAFGRTKTPIDWESLDGTPAQIVFLLAVPESCKGDEHLRIIASLSRQLIHEDFRKKLENSKDEAEIVALISDVLN
ncbi:PTS fructose transporter subunit IIA [Bacilli bacterium]|nr:PTS fructose transporter subunit IIA [Bacilli bacterium]GHU43618.1 PTS fructose transporter subunit IIA [Bacilli bacterium]